MNYEVMIDKIYVYIEHEGRHETVLADVITYIDNDEDVGSIQGTMVLKDLVFFKEGKPLTYTEFMTFFNDGKHVATLGNEIVVTVRTISSLHIKTVAIAKKVLQFASGQNELLDREFQEALLAKAVELDTGYQYTLSRSIAGKTLVCISEEAVVFEDTQPVAYSQKMRGIYVYVLDQHNDNVFTTKTGKVVYAFTTLPYKKGQV